MSSRRAVPAIIASAFALLFFGLGNYLGARQTADSDEQLAAMRSEIAQLKRRAAEPAGTTGRSADLDGPSRQPIRRAPRSWPTSSGSSRTRWGCCRSTCCAIAAPASSSSTRTTTTGRAATARPATWARGTSSPSNTASSRSTRRARRIREPSPRSSWRTRDSCSTRESSMPAMPASKSTRATGRS